MSAAQLGCNLLPIIVGITGHRDIPPEYAVELENRVESQLLQLQRQYPHCPVIVLSSLADGADRICARAALKAGCRLRVPLPMAREEYEKDFDEISRREFGELLSQADDIFVAAAIEPVPESPPRGYFYRQAGLYIAKRAHLLIALWDGRETLYPEGGGTFESVDLMRRENGIVFHIPAPRLSAPETVMPEAEVVLQEDKRLSAIEEFNLAIVAQKEKLNDMVAQSKSDL
ncbi:MAG: hypothetical protein LBL15_01865 [Oscillospiraceae bacterium]|jgi:hypothetical protein|nr:hypothetical protein [Oscillospiraceae bacterium]